MKPFEVERESLQQYTASTHCDKIPVSTPYILNSLHVLAAPHPFGAELRGQH